jgi:asparagine synthase (glutamine-hydrolysing)
LLGGGYSSGGGAELPAPPPDPLATRQAGLDPRAVGRLWQAFLDHAPGLYWSRIWTLYVLVRWCERHGVHA